MLLFKTTVRPDAFGGNGLFAAEAIPAGAVVWVWHDAVERVFTPDELVALPPPFKAFLDKFGYPLAGRPGHVVLNLDDSRFMNHADEPNLTEIESGTMIARRNIAAGEELTSDYREFDPELRMNAWLRGEPRQP